MQPCQCSDHLTGGRRMVSDRRNNAYACCIPERRSGVDRRRRPDRRQHNRMVAIMVAVDKAVASVSNRPGNAMD